jgi:hypothetical protein
MSSQNTQDIQQEFDRQVGDLIQKDYPRLAGMTEEKFINLLTPLKRELTEISLSKKEGRLQFVIVIKNELVPADSMMPLVQLNGKDGLVKLFPLEPKDFHVIESVKIPESSAYLLIDIDRGQETLNVAPIEAMKTIEKHHRSPLTIDEGIAVLTHYPEFLKKNNCFSLLASRHTGDKRVPAIWINADKRPHLGWCWNGN